MKAACSHTRRGGKAASRKGCLAFHHQVPLTHLVWQVGISSHLRKCPKCGGERYFWNVVFLAGLKAAHELIHTTEENLSQLVACLSSLSFLGEGRGRIAAWGFLTDICGDSASTSRTTRRKWKVVNKAAPQ